MPKDEKGLNRGGIGGQEGELGEESKNLDVKRSASGQQDKPGQQPQRPGQPGQRPDQPQRPGQPGQPGQRPDQPQRQGQPRQPGQPGQRPDQPQRQDQPGQQERPAQQRGGGMPGSMNEQQRGGLRREPDLEKAEKEKDTGHEVE